VASSIAVLRRMYMDWKQYRKGTPQTFQKLSIHPKFSWNISHVQGTQCSPLTVALEYSQCAKTMNTMLGERRPCSWYCLAAQERVSIIRVIQDQRHSATILMSTSPRRGYRMVPMKKS
jgi:hypothetical protein